ncbi:TIGR03089 family protein [Cellulomonas sp. ES6]|uniref:TIGR03089 family protein n=1 Tax=Cellulomonas sp. ES6 TaxID=3039384 RepID=UPI0024B86605|nr:TIGR03089 family protein [Cellulomonas sp. ES6]WHP17220.1 TIGR03089 family protein [Cellulomonas sp. ES6]
MPTTPPPSPRRPATVAAALSALLTEPGRPRVTWYGPAGERIELSGAVLDNWVSKTTNLLVEELDAGPGTTVRVDLPPHWRSVVWTLAAWRVGATVLPPGAPDGDVVVTDRPDAAAPRGAAVVAVALPALARRFDGGLPPGALDAAASVMTYGDVVGWAPEVEPQREALAGVPGGEVRHADLLERAAGAAARDGAAGARVLLEVGDDRAATPSAALAVLGVLAGGGSVVLLRPEAGDDAARADRVAATERVTARL